MTPAELAHTNGAAVTINTPHGTTITYEEAPGRVIFSQLRSYVIGAEGEAMVAYLSNRDGLRPTAKMRVPRS